MEIKPGRETEAERNPKGREREDGARRTETLLERMSHGEEDGRRRDKEGERAGRAEGRPGQGLGKRGCRPGAIRAKALSFAFSPGPCLSGGPSSSLGKGPELHVQRPPGENFTWN